MQRKRAGEERVRIEKVIHLERKDREEWRGRAYGKKKKTEEGNRFRVEG